MKNFAGDDSIDNFESTADPAHAPSFTKSGATNAGPGAVGGNADAPGSREVGSRGHEADASDATDAACAEEEIAREEEIVEVNAPIYRCILSAISMTLNEPQHSVAKSIPRGGKPAWITFLLRV